MCSECIFSFLSSFFSFLPPFLPVSLLASLLPFFVLELYPGPHMLDQSSTTELHTCHPPPQLSELRLTVTLSVTFIEYKLHF